MLFGSLSRALKILTVLIEPLSENPLHQATLVGAERFHMTLELGVPRRGDAGHYSLTVTLRRAAPPGSMFRKLRRHGATLRHDDTFWHC